MQLKKQIKAFFFLGIFSMLMLHQIFPHLHHEHDNANHEIAETDHGHSHDHDENQEEKNSFLSFLLATHTHLGNANEVLVVETTYSDYHKKKENKVVGKIDNHQSLFSDIPNKTEKELVYQPPNLYFNPYLSYLSLRGPPALG